MNLKQLFFGLGADAGRIGINMTNVTLPLDIAIELVLRQQSQLFSMMSELQAQANVGEQVVANMGERLSILGQALHGATKHPVERVDEETSAQDSKKKERPN